MTKAETKKTLQVIGAVVGVAVVATIVQFARFRMKVKEVVGGGAIVFPKNYFPFNGTYTISADGKATKN